MADKEKPVILLVHGAWHNPSHLRPLTSDLQAEGFTVLTPSLASAGFGDSIDTASQIDDARRLTEAVRPHIERGLRVVGVAHSYGALPLAHAIHGLTAKERAAAAAAGGPDGGEGGFTAAVFIAPMPYFDTGVTALAASDGKWLGNWFFTPTDTRLELKMDAAPDAFYNDTPEPARSEATAQLGGQSTLPYNTVIECTPAGLDLPKTMVVCADDRTFSRDLQLLTAERWGCQRTVEVPSGHTPWLRAELRPRLVEAIKEAENGV